jgi:uncharacterized protein YecT (DUF1311 family)
MECLRKEKFRIVFVILSAIGLASGATAEQTEFPAKRFPFIPNLVVDRNPPLCKIALEDARGRFKETAIDTSVNIDESRGIAWVKWEDAVSLVDEKESIKALSLDLDGLGKKQTVLYRSFEHSWRGENYYAYLVRTTATMNELKKKPEQASELLSGLEASLEAKAKSTDIIPYYPSAFLGGGELTDRVSTGSNWEPHKLFRWRNRYYFYDEQHRWGRLRQSDRSLYRLRGNGKVDLTCKIQLLPEAKAFDDFRNLPGLASFVKVLKTIGTGGSGDCGTLQSGVRHEGEALAAINRAAIRPWAVSRSDGSYHIYDERMRSFIEDWGIGDVWNRRETQTLSEHIEPASKAMEGYFIQKFGLNPNEAKKHAKVVVEELIAAWLQVPGGYLPGEDLYSIQYSPATKSIMVRDMKALKEALAQPASPSPYPKPKPLSDLLHDAAEWSDGMALLLKGGADPNLPQGGESGFGKRPLMTAAHMNRPDSVKLLLKHGADPSLRTVKEKSECGMTIERGDRTALMYAAENAGLGVMKLLLDAGADPAAKDSKGNGVDFYLALNPRFSPEEKQLDLSALVKLKQGNLREPGFDCAKATTRIEKTICGDEILRMMDGEMTDAYLRWQRTRGAEAKDDQRQWIRSRDASCNAGDKQRDIGCLQDKTRARVRYLHNRLEEMPPS